MPITNDKEQNSMTKPNTKVLNAQIKRASTLDDLGCRRGALGHAWRPVRPDFDTNLAGAQAVALQCIRCHTIKRGVVVKKNGEWLSPPSYDYPEGYQLKKEPGTKGPVLSAQAVRAAFARITLSEIDDLPDMSPHETE